MQVINADHVADRMRVLLLLLNVCEETLCSQPRRKNDEEPVEYTFRFSGRFLLSTHRVMVKVKSAG